jgi:hypothetical protein
LFKLSLSLSLPLFYFFFDNYLTFPLLLSMFYRRLPACSVASLHDAKRPIVDALATLRRPLGDLLVGRCVDLPVEAVAELTNGRGGRGSGGGYSRTGSSSGGYGSSWRVGKLGSLGRSDFAQGSRQCCANHRFFVHHFFQCMCLSLLPLSFVFLFLLSFYMLWSQFLYLRVVSFCVLMS